MASCVVIVVTRVRSIALANQRVNPPSLGGLAGMVRMLPSGPSPLQSLFLLVGSSLFSYVN